MNNPHKMVLPTFNTFEVIAVDRIIWIKAFSNYSQIHLSEGNTIMSNLSFGKLSYILHEHCFVTCHKSFTINLYHLLRYHKDGFAEMSDGTNLPVARRRRESFIECMEKCYEVHLDFKERVR